MAVKIKKSVGNWSKGAKNDPQDVTQIQKLLATVATNTKLHKVKPKGASGRISKPPKISSTVRAITQFQKMILGYSNPDGLIEPGKTTITALNRLNDSTGFDKMKGVNPPVSLKVCRFIARFDSVKITDGKRTLNIQAKRMVKMNDKGLNMYNPKGGKKESAYVTAIKKIPISERTVLEVEAIISAARKKGSRISHHLTGNAVDISARKTGFKMTKAMEIARRVGLKPKDEKFRNCFHVNG